jgi:hypothetical protein
MDRLRTLLVSNSNTSFSSSFVPKLAILDKHPKLLLNRVRNMPPNPPSWPLLPLVTLFFFLAFRHQAQGFFDFTNIVFKKQFTKQVCKQQTVFIFFILVIFMSRLFLPCSLGKFYFCVFTIVNKNELSTKIFAKLCFLYVFFPQNILKISEFFLTISSNNTAGS